MAFPDSVTLTYADGSTRTLLRDTIVEDWQSAPVNGLHRIDFGGTDQSVVLSGADIYWAYRESANIIVLGWHVPGQEGGASEFWQELLFDRRGGQVTITERDANSVPQAASVKNRLVTGTP